MIRKTAEPISSSNGWEVSVAWPDFEPEPKREPKREPKLGV